MRILLFRTDLGTLCVPSCGVVIASVLLDYLFFGEFVLVAFNFLRFNLGHNVAVQYGTHPWHWYRFSTLSACPFVPTLTVAEWLSGTYLKLCLWSS